MIQRILLQHALHSDSPAGKVLPHLLSLVRPPPPHPAPTPAIYTDYVNVCVYTQTHTGILFFLNHLKVSLLCDSFL